MPDRSSLWSSPVVTHRAISPDASKLIPALQHVGYSTQHAVADVIDNSIDAGARNILVRIVIHSDNTLSVMVIDDGHGMTSSELSEAMRLGSGTKRAETNLGKFSVGLKFASISQSDNFYVASRKTGSMATAMRWTQHGMVESDCLVLEGAPAEELMQDCSPIDCSTSGTLVCWEDITRGRVRNMSPETLRKSLAGYLGLYFHRFIESSRIKFLIDVETVVETESLPFPILPLNPLTGRYTNRASFPTECEFNVDAVGMVKARAVVWDPTATTQSNYKLSEQQARSGFYFYRNDRLIHAGGWCSLWAADVMEGCELARIAVDIPPSSEGDAAFGVNVAKSSVNLPNDALRQAFRSLLFNNGHTVEALLAIAKLAARDLERSRSSRTGPVIPAAGLPATLIKKCRLALHAANREVTGITIVWDTLDDSEFFEIDSSNDRLVLNTTYRKRTIHGTHAGSADAPMVKILVFLLSKDYFSRSRSSKQSEEWLATCNRILVAAAKLQDG